MLILNNPLGVRHLVQEVYDNTNFGEKRGTLVGFISDVNAEKVFALDVEARMHIVLEALAAFVGPQALEP